MKYTIIGSITLFIAIGLIAYYNYTQHYNQDSKSTATSGIFFKTTLNLSEYKNVSTGNDLWGTFNRYSRSDRHGDVLTIYCNDFCQKD